MAKMTMKKHPDEKEDKALIKKMIMKASAGAKKPMASKTKSKTAKKGY